MSACRVDLGRLTDYIGALPAYSSSRTCQLGLRHCAREAFCGRR